MNNQGTQGEFTSVNLRS